MSILGDTIWATTVPFDYSKKISSAYTSTAPYEIILNVKSKNSDS